MFDCRPPRGGRGLKSMFWLCILVAGSSPPSRGAWIEIEYLRKGWIIYSVAPLAGGVD